MSYTETQLARGGKLIHWDNFVLQVGAYPETIKDTMQLTEGVPQLYLVPGQLFDARLGISAAELEFPVYFNYYLKGRKIRFICRQAQLRPILRVLKEAIFGPTSLHHEDEYPDGLNSPGFPDLAREMAFYKEDSRCKDGRLRFGDLVTPMVFDAQGQVVVEGVTVTALDTNRFRLEKAGESHDIEYQWLDSEPLPASTTSFQPPLFGLTVLGSGHGFDAKTRTSGFLLWINGKGVLVDPPVHATEWLRQNRIDSRLVEDLVLTHCHADHDSGTLQKILQEGRVNLRTTETVRAAFVRKYRSLTGLSSAQFRSLFNFEPVPVGVPVNIAGAEFTFWYTLHPIPTLGLKVRFQGKTFAYSGDNLYCPKTIQELHQRGILSKSRMEALLDFPWGADLVLHEAGIPPIHTPMQVLVDRPQEVKDHLWLTHVSESAIPNDSGLRLAPTGVENTLAIPVEAPETSLAEHMLDVLIHIDLFRSLPLDKSLEFLRITSYSKVSPGTVLVRTGDRGDSFHMILSGEAEIVQEGQTVKRAGRYDYFGEMALVLDQPRIADVVARTELEVLSIPIQDFLNFIRKTPLPALLRRVSQNKMHGSWSIFAHNRLLSELTTLQRTQLLSIMSRRELPEGTRLFAREEPVESFLLVDQGEVDLEQLGGRTSRVGRGALLGRVEADRTNCHHQVTAVCATPLVAYEIRSSEMMGFFQTNPGLYVRALGSLQTTPDANTIG